MPGDVPKVSTVLKHIPDPTTCQVMLSRAAREAELLRWLLKLSNRKADLDRSGRQEVQPCKAS